MSCNLCLSSNSKVIMDFGAFPIAHQYMNAVTDKRECYPFQLALCEDCNHVFIPNPISPSILYQNYVTLSDWKFQPHIPRLIELIQQYAVNKQATILEVGCNDGRFLKSLQEVGFTNIHGIEPASDACDMAKKKGIQVIQGFFNQDTADQFVTEKGKCDLFIKVTVPPINRRHRGRGSNHKNMKKPPAEARG